MKQLLNFLRTTKLCIKTSYVHLFNIMNNILYVNIPSIVGEAGLCFDEKRCIVMKKILENNGRLQVFSTEIPNNETEYKIRIVFRNRTYADTGILQR